MDERFGPNIWCIKFLHKFHWQEEKMEESLKSKAECLFSTRTIPRSEPRKLWLRYWGSIVGLWLHPWLSSLTKFLWKVNLINYTGGLLFLPVSYGRSWTIACWQEGSFILDCSLLPEAGHCCWVSWLRDSFQKSFESSSRCSPVDDDQEFPIIGSLIFSYLKIDIHN